MHVERDPDRRALGSLADFIADLRNVDTHGARFAGTGRGGDLRSHDEWIQTCFRRSEGLLDVPRLRELWRKLRELPRVQTHGPMTLVHASPESLWQAPSPEAGDADLELAFGSLDTPISIYGHIHCAYVRNLPRRIVANTGSVSLSYDGDRRAAYLLLDDANPSIRRVTYDMDKELKALANCRLPHTEWLAKTLQMARPQMPAAISSN